MLNQTKLKLLTLGGFLSIMLGFMPFAFCLSFFPYVLLGFFLKRRRIVLGSFLDSQSSWCLFFNFFSSLLISYLSLLNFWFLFSPEDSQLKEGLLSWIDLFFYSLTIESFPKIFLVFFLVSFSLQIISTFIIYQLFSERSLPSTEETENLAEIFSKAKIQELKEFI